VLPGAHTGGGAEGSVSGTHMPSVTVQRFPSLQAVDWRQSSGVAAMHTPCTALQAPSFLQPDDCLQSSFASAAQRPAMAPHRPWAAHASDCLQSPSAAKHAPPLARHCAAFLHSAEA
jgi:hypothetical protein